MHTYKQIGLMVPDVYLPREGIDMEKWAVIACDQFTSQPEYWQQVSAIVGDAPSSYHLTLPEVYLGKPEEASRLSSVRATMQQYLDENILEEQEGMIYVERQVAGKTRAGLVVALDLEQYDFHTGSASLIRATEDTILDRLPPRIRIRENALLELPHILILIDDPDRNVIEPLAEQKSKLQPVYQTDLMLGSGHVDGWRILDASIEANIVHGLMALLDPNRFRAKYQLDVDRPLLLYSVGDGNHSLATAKAIWEKLKPTVGMDHPARYALVEIENVHCDGLSFEPIHRVVFQTRAEPCSALQQYFGEKCRIRQVADMDQLKQQVQASTLDGQRFGMISAEGYRVVELDHPAAALPVGNLQLFLDPWIQSGGAEGIDYIHGDEVVATLGQKPGNCGFYLPTLQKTDLFRTVILDGALPRKTFSMGEAIEKRFYMEARRIQ